MSQQVRTLGIWLEVAGPAYNRMEGIARVVSLLIGHFRERGLKIVVALPTETRQPFLETLADLGVRADESFRFVTVPSQAPPLRRLEERLDAKRRAFLRDAKYRSRQVIKEGVLSKKLSLFTDAVQSLNWKRVGAGSGRLGRLAVKFGLKGIAGVVGLPAYAGIKAASWLAYRDHDWRALLVEAANQETDIDLWYVMNPTWHYARGLNKPVVTAVWDLVYKEYPEGFDVADLDAKIRPLLERTSATISMSRHVRDAHVVGGTQFPPERAFAVSIPCVAPVAETFDPGRLTQREAKRKVEAFLRERYSAPPQYERYLCDFPLSKVDYLVAASNIRPYKNYVRLAQAFEYLVRRRRRNLKLIVTGGIKSDPAFYHYLMDNGLVFDILSVPNLPTNVLRCLFRGASATVMPSLFEGGFPLTFMESVSLGTPVAMGRIPTVKESIIPEDGIEQTLFDPLDTTDMARAIELCLDQPQEVLAKQRAVMDRLQCTDWKATVDRYLEVFDFALRTPRLAPVVEPAPAVSTLNQQEVP